MAALPFIPPIIKWALSIGGEIDFVVSRSQDPGWIMQVIYWVIDPPGWAIFPLIIAGLSLIYWDVRRRPSEDVRGASTEVTHSASQAIPLTAATPIATNIEGILAPAGFLDYIVEGGEACKNISNSQYSMNRKARVTTRYMKICKWFLYLTSNAKLRRTIASKLALKLSEYAKTVRNHASMVRESAAIIEHNWSSVINETTTATDNDLLAFGGFHRMILLAISTIEEMNNATEESNFMASEMTGISRDLNSSLASLSNASAELSEELRSFIERLGRIDRLCQEKLNIVNRNI